MARSSIFTIRHLGIALTSLRTRRIRCLLAEEFNDRTKNLVLRFEGPQSLAMGGNLFQVLLPCEQVVNACD